MTQVTEAAKASSGVADAEEAYRVAHPDRLRFYDVALDEYRDVTQEDVDLWVTHVNRLAALRTDIGEMIKGDHRRAIEQIEEIKARGQNHPQPAG